MKYSLILDKDRRTGRTHIQIEHLPKDGIFIWCNDHLAYPRDLARKIGRADVKIYGRSILLEPWRLYGLHLSGASADHACHQLSAEEWHGWFDIKSRIQ